MKVSDLKTKLNYEEVCAGDSDADIRSGYTSDLLSDVMGNALDDSVLVTIQAHKNGKISLPFPVKSERF